MNIGYKLCGNQLVKLQILDEESNNNNDTSELICFKAKVLDIFPVSYAIDQKKLTQIKNTFYRYKSILYKINEIVEAKDGIYYYKNKEVAEFFYTPLLESQGYTGKCKQYYPNGNLFANINFNYGKYHNECFWYNKNGSLKEHGCYNKGHKFGSYSIYYESGTLYIQCNYNEFENLHGIYEEYTYLGVLLKKYLYNNGLLDGKCYDYYTNGNKKEICYYKDNKKNGICKNYDSSGKLLAKINCV